MSTHLARWILPLLTLGASLITSHALAAESGRPPNIVFILADDKYDASAC